MNPWAIHVGANDRPRLELTGLATRSTSHAWVVRCTAPEVRAGGVADAASDVYALGAILGLFATVRPTTEMLRGLIERATATDPDARPSANEIARMIAGSPTLTTGRVPIQHDADTRPSRPGMGLALGRFELVRQLGVGAMGEVWEARDTAGGPNVAIKLLKPEIASDAELLRRFRKEARVLAKVGSPYIANIIDLNEDRGLHYLVLELVTGGSVAAALRKLERLPERFAFDIIADTCRALAEPHRLGIVHRDIKPDNMMFVRAGLELETAPVGQVIKLGDFGIARLVESQAADGATREGTVLGTPEFMAPEQCQGAQVTPATDVYALGCCLYALIAGHPPFTIKDDNQMGVILQHLNERRTAARGCTGGRRAGRALSREGSEATTTGRGGSARRDRTDVRRHRGADHRASGAAGGARDLGDHVHVRVGARELAGGAVAVRLEHREDESRDRPRAGAVRDRIDEDLDAHARRRPGINASPACR